MVHFQFQDHDRPDIVAATIALACPRLDVVQNRIVAVSFLLSAETLSLCRRLVKQSDCRKLHAQEGGVIKRD